MTEFGVTPPEVNGAPITAVDIEARNGVIHVIGEVMIPTNFVLQDVGDTNDNPQTGDYQGYLIVGLFIVGAALFLVSRKRRQATQQD